METVVDNLGLIGGIISLLRYRGADLPENPQLSGGHLAYCDRSDSALSAFCCRLAPYEKAGSVLLIGPPNTVDKAGVPERRGFFRGHSLSLKGRRSASREKRQMTGQHSGSWQLIRDLPAGARTSRAISKGLHISAAACS